MTASLIEARNVGRQAGDRRLLSNVSLSIQAGERRALVGPSGSGKTLLLRALAMLDPIDRGEIRWHGNTVRGVDVPRFRSQVMYLHQRPALPQGTVIDTLRQPFSLKIHRTKQFDHARIVSLLKSLGRSESFLPKQTRDLSGGELQLTALLRAMQLNPVVLLLDEPTAALDGEATAMVEQLIANWLGQQLLARSSLWVTHDLDQARRVSDSLQQIHDGQLAGGSVDPIR